MTEGSPPRRPFPENPDPDWRPSGRIVCYDTPEPGGGNCLVTMTEIQAVASMEATYPMLSSLSPWHAMDEFKIVHWAYYQDERAFASVAERDEAILSLLKIIDRWYADGLRMGRRREDWAEIERCRRIPTVAPKTEAEF